MMEESKKGNLEVTELRSYRYKVRYRIFETWTLPSGGF